MIVGKYGKQRKIRRVKKTLADGRVKLYYYAFNGGPMFWESDGPIPIDYANPPVGFHEARNAHLEEEKERPPETTIDDLIDRLQHQDAKYKQLADSSRETYAVYFKEVATEYGDAPIGTFANIKIRADVIAWRDKFADTPRAADYRVAALGRVITYAIELGFLTDNHIHGISQLYDSDRAAIIWTAEDLERWNTGDPDQGVRPANRTEREIVMHARFTGLRRTNLAELSRTNDKGDHLQVFAVKGRRKKRVEVIIPITPDYRAFLDATYADQAEREVSCLNLITNRSGQPVTPNGIGQAMRKRSIALGIDKHLHDLRGTFATELMRAGFQDHEIAEIVGWTASKLREIRRKYIDRKAIISAGISRLSAERSRNRY